MRRIFIQNPLSANSQLPTSVASERGQSSVYFIICIMVVLLAVSLVGGFGTLMSGDTPFPVADTPATTSTTPGPTSSGSGTTPSPTTTPFTWIINYTPTFCLKETVPQQEGKIQAIGDENGYMTIEIEEGSTTKVIATDQFKTPSTRYTINLSSADGFTNKKWKIGLFSGGSQTGGKWSGGTLKVYYQGAATGC